MKLSIVIPIYNQPLSLDLTLFWFEKVISDECEIIVIDDGSTENIREIVEKYEKTINLKYVYRNNGGRSAARNTGLFMAEGNRVLFNDGDRFPALSDLRDHINAKGVMTGAHMEFYFMRPEKKVDVIKNDFEKIKHQARKIAFPSLVRDNLYDPSGNCATNMGWMSFLTGNVSAPKDALIEVKGFDEGFISWGVEHFDLGYRLWNLNIPFEFSDKSVNYHIAHGREAGFYRNNMKNSTDYFYSKYNDPLLHSFADFLFGLISLQELEEKAKNVRFDVAPWLSLKQEDIFFKGLQSDILAKPSQQ